MLDREILVAALEGLLAQRQKIDEQIQQVKKMIAETPAPPPILGEKKRNLTPAARKRIADAQHRRWWKFGKEQGEK